MATYGKYQVYYEKIKTEVEKIKEENGYLNLSKAFAHWYLENALKMLNSRQFLLVERGYAVNIKQICRVSGDTIYLEKGYEVPVSKARLAEVKREINLYWRNS